MNRFGIVALVGKPNVGKSTLLNALIGEELAIVSPKPQTTRVPTMGILTRDDTQILFKDAPGLLEPRYALQVALRHHALRVMREAHLVLHLHPLSDHPAPPLAAAAGLDRPPRSPVLTVYSKADLMPAPRRPALASAEVAISAQSGEGLAPLLERCRQHLDEGPFAYDAESISLQPVRFFAAEYVREAAFAQLGQELPYSVHVEIDEFREGSDPLYIRATVYVERASQKGMVIGDRGRRIKVLGTAARTRIETLVGARVFLDLRVKVLPKWRRRASTLNALGYTP